MDLKDHFMILTFALSLSHSYPSVTILSPFWIPSIISVKRSSLIPVFTGFEIAGADKVFHKANASVTGFHEITVWSDAVPQPVAVRYSFRNFAPGNLKSVFGIPAIPFRTDDWNDVR